MPPGPNRRILLTGATGYIGGILLGALGARGEEVRCLVRNPRRMSPPPPGCEVRRGDVLEADGLPGCLAGIHTAFYLVHAMGSTADFEAEELLGARNFAEAARSARVRRIIYLGGLAPENARLSVHMRSRLEVGRILRSAGCEVIELRASVVLGAGSLSFEMIRALVERLPVMVTPRWVSVLCQPIAAEDLVRCLTTALDLPLEGDRVYEIGGPERISYAGLMEEYAKLRRLRRFMIPVPVLTPRLSSYWLGLVTPFYARVGRRLIASIEHPSVVTHPPPPGLFAFEPAGPRKAMRRALEAEERLLDSRSLWEYACSARARKGLTGVWAGARVFDSRSAVVRATPRSAFVPIREIGGARGWLYANFLWRLRGRIDQVLGGPGLRRGRRHPSELRPGEHLDWWIVEKVSPDRTLRLRAQMKLPGRAWLEFEIVPLDQGCEMRQTACFEPRGLPGLLYWVALSPIHQMVFRGMFQAIVRRAAPTG